MHISINIYGLFERLNGRSLELFANLIWKLGVGACKRGIRQGVQSLVRIMLICYLIHVRRNLDLYYHFMICCYLDRYDPIIWFMWFHIPRLLNSQTAPCPLWSFTFDPRGKKFTSYKEDCSPYSVATEVLYCSAEPPCGQLHVGVHLWTNGCIYPVGHMGRAYGIRWGISTPAL